MPNGSCIDTRPYRQQATANSPAEIGRNALAAVLCQTSDCYLACALEVIEAITLVAILNCSSRLSMPWRRAIQPKSV